jgi:hypothetical protein
MKLHDILNEEDDGYYFYTEDDESLFYFKRKSIIYRIIDFDNLKSKE